MKGKSVWAVAAALACLLLGLGGCTPGLSEDLPLEEMIQRGDTAWWDGDEERARAFYETAVKVYPDQPAGCLSLAWLAKGEFDLEGAISWYEAALERDPSLTDTWSELANLVALSGREEEAEEVLAEAYDRTRDREFLEAEPGGSTYEMGSMGITDLSPLASAEWVHRLETLLLEVPKVEDYSPLAGLTGLRDLRIFSGQVADLSFLSGMDRLEYLHLGTIGEEPVSLKPLAGCRSLQRLSINVNYENGWTVSSLEGLEGLTGLRILEIPRTAVTDLSPLEACKNLERLDLRRTQVTDLSPLAGCDSLKVLYLGRADVEDFTPLENCPLEVIYLGGQSEENVYALSLLFPEVELRNG